MKTGQLNPDHLSETLCVGTPVDTFVGHFVAAFVGAKRDRSFFFCFGHLLATILSLFLLSPSFLPRPLCGMAMKG